LRRVTGPCLQACSRLPGAARYDSSILDPRNVMVSIYRNQSSSLSPSVCFCTASISGNSSTPQNDHCGWPLFPLPYVSTPPNLAPASARSPAPSPRARSSVPRSHRQNHRPHLLVYREQPAGAGGPVGVRAQIIPAWRLAAWPRLTISVHIGGRVANNTARIRTNRTVSAINSLAYNHDMTLPLVR
jgi:hypothetical protein